MIRITRLRAADAQAWRALRREALRAHPEAFASSEAELDARPVESTAAMLDAPPPGAVFGAFDGAALVGMAGLSVQSGEKTRHNALLWGVYVTATHRGQGISRRLVQAVIDAARGHVLVLHAGVIASNTTAAALYTSLGFTQTGYDRRSLLVDGVFHAEIHLALDLDGPHLSAATA